MTLFRSVASISTDFTADPHSALERARAFGIDVSLVQSSLRRTLAERLRDLDENARFCSAIQRRDRATSLLAMIGGLERAGVPFVVIGGVARVAHGSTYVAMSLEIVHDPSPAATDALVALLRSRGAEVDLFTHVDGVGDYAACEVESEWIDVPPMRFRVLGLDSLIRAKRADTRDTDRGLLLELELIRELKREVQK